MQLDRKWGLLFALMLALFAGAGRAAAQSAPTPTFIDSQVLFAVVNSDGALARGNGAVSAGAISPGNYEVVFNRDVTGCAYKATIGLSGSSGTSLPGSLGVVGRGGNPNGVFINTYDSGGLEAARGFHLAVFCP
jgi:hypothetical protein